jgi:hypothetical protein
MRQPTAGSKRGLFHDGKFWIACDAQHDSQRNGNCSWTTRSPRANRRENARFTDHASHVSQLSAPPYLTVNSKLHLMMVGVATI